MRAAVAAVAALEAFALSTNQCIAENDPGGPGTAVATGNCSRLIASADDHTAKCDPQAASVTLEDGTIFFVFTIEGTPIGFSGAGRLVEPVGEGIAKLPVNFVSVGENGELGVFEAEGQCVFGDPYSGAANIWCIAMTKVGPFLATFKTDGSRPARSNE